MTDIVSTEGKLQSKDGTQIFFMKNMPPQPKVIVIIVHGVAEHAGRYGYTTQRFNQFGYGVYRFDNRGHGRSGGERGYVRSFMDFIRDTDLLVQMAHHENDGLPVFMLGHSMGGFIATAYGVEYPDQLDGQILSGPSVIELPLKDVRLLKRLPYNLLPKLRVGNKLGLVVSRDQTVIDAYNKDQYNLQKTTLKLSGEMFIKGPAWLQNNIGRYRIPCLILHGSGDLIVTPKASEWLYESISSQDKERKVYPDLYHEIMNEKEKDIVIEDIHIWIEKHINKK